MNLIDAILNEDPEQVKQLLAEGADPNASQDRAKITPLHFAAQRNALNIVPLLIEAGAHLNAQTYPEGDTPIQIAQLHGHINMVNLLVAYENQLYMGSEH